MFIHWRDEQDDEVCQCCKPANISNARLVHRLMELQTAVDVHEAVIGKRMLVVDWTDGSFRKL